MSVIFSGTRTIQSGVNRTPSAAVPAGSSRCDITMTRANWPAAGVSITILLTYDGTNYVPVAPPNIIGPGSVDPKTGVIPPAAIGFGWGHDPQPLRALIETDNPSGNFSTQVTISVA